MYLIQKIVIGDYNYGESRGVIQTKVATDKLTAIDIQKEMILLDANEDFAEEDKLTSLEDFFKLPSVSMITYSDDEIIVDDQDRELETLYSITEI